MTKFPLAFPTIAALFLGAATAWSMASFKPSIQHQSACCPQASPVFVSLEKWTWPKRLSDAKDRGDTSAYWTKSTEQQRQSFTQYYVRMMRANMQIKWPQHSQYMTIQEKDSIPYRTRMFWARRWWNEQSKFLPDGPNEVDAKAMDSAIRDANELLFLRVVDVQRNFVSDDYETVYQQIRQLPYFQREFAIVEKSLQ